MAFEIEDEAKDEKALFDAVEFWSSLPSEHPSGAKDLRFAHRQAQNREGKTINFYEIVCESKKERFCFGQRSEGGRLFPKGWEPVYQGDEHDSSDEQPRTRPEMVPRQQASPASAAVPSKSAGAMTKEQRLTAQIRELFESLGVNNAGLEKATTMKALNMRSGKILQELAYTEQLDLYEYLVQQSKAGQRKVA